MIYWAYGTYNLVGSYLLTGDLKWNFRRLARVWVKDWRDSGCVTTADAQHEDTRRSMRTTRPNPRCVGKEWSK